MLRGRRILFVFLLALLVSGISQGQGVIPLPPPADTISPDAGNVGSYNCFLQPVGCGTLKTFYTTTGGANWTDNTGWWESGTGVCNFHGVTCLLVLVTGLDLSNNNLTGTLPSTLDTLVGLINVDVSRNSIGGELPLGLLNGILQLTELDVSGNMLTGLPDQLSTITNLLGGLDVSYNMIAESDPLLLNILIDNDWLDTQTVPPSNLAISSIGAQSITLDWDAILYTGDSGGYDVRYRPVGSGGWTIAPRTANKSAETLTITGLAENTAYEFEIRSVTLPHAQNPNTLITQWVQGASGAVTGTTGAPDPTAPGAPGGDIELIGGINIRIFDFLVGLNLGTQIQIAPVGSGDWITIDLGANVNDYTITGLDCGTTYELRIRSLDLLSLLFGAFSSLGTIATQPCAPDAPTTPAGFGTTVLSSTSVQVNWSGDDPSDTYEIQYSTDGSNWTTVTASAGATSHVISGLDCGTTYSFRMRAANGGQFSPYTNTAMATTNSCAPTPPAVPTDFAVSITGPNSALASWTNGGALLTYEVEASTDGLNWATTTAPAGSSSVAISDLACGTAYIFRLRSFDPAAGMYSDFTPTMLGTTQACAIDPVELLTNGGFEIDANNDKVADEWRAFGQAHANHKRVTKANMVHSGTAAHMFKASTHMKRSLKQKVLNAGGQTGDILVGSVWAASKNTLSGSQAKMIVILRYTDNTKGKLKIKTPSGTLAYAQYTNTLVAAKPYNIVITKFVFRAPRGKWMIDDASVMRQPTAS